jgi:hypothetical protein
MLSFVRYLETIAGNDTSVFGFLITITCFLQVQFTCESRSCHWGAAFFLLFISSWASGLSRCTETSEIVATVSTRKSRICICGRSLFSFSVFLHFFNVTSIIDIIKANIEITNLGVSSSFLRSSRESHGSTSLETNV